MHQIRLIRSGNNENHNIPTKKALKLSCQQRTAPPRRHFNIKLKLVEVGWSCRSWRWSYLCVKFCRKEKAVTNLKSFLLYNGTSTSIFFTMLWIFILLSTIHLLYGTPTNSLKKYIFQEFRNTYCHVAIRNRRLLFYFMKE